VKEDGKENVVGPSLRKSPCDSFRFPGGALVSAIPNRDAVGEGGVGYLAKGAAVASIGPGMLRKKKPPYALEKGRRGTPTNPGSYRKTGENSTIGTGKEDKIALRGKTKKDPLAPSKH